MQPVNGPPVNPFGDGALMEMLADLYRCVNVALEAADCERLPWASVGGTPTVPGHYILALQPAAE